MTTQNSRISLSILAEQINDLRGEIRALRDEIRALRAEMRETLTDHDCRLRTLEREQARLMERTGILVAVGSALATAVSAVLSFIRR